MKLTSALGALGASNLLFASVGAVDLDISSPDSIKQTAKSLSANLRKYYTGDNPGDTPGNLPDPYYWWECGAMFNAFVDYWYYTGDDQYNKITTQALEAQIGVNANYMPDNQTKTLGNDDQYNKITTQALEAQIGVNANYMPDNQTKTLGNDDQAFWGMAAMTAAENKFPDLPDGKPSWLSLAQAVFNTQYKRWDMSTCGGGLRWQIFSFNQGYNYKNTISNGCFFNIASRLYKYLGNQTYADWAEKAWEWELSVGLMSPDYHYYDGTDDTQNCSTINHIQWTYNAGIHMAGAAAMWNVSQDEKWKTRVQGVIDGIDVFFKDKVMSEVACENNGKCDVDQRSFKAYLARSMAYTASVAPWSREQIDPYLQASAQAAAKQCNGGDQQTSCGLKWTTNGVNDGSFGVGEQMAAMEVVQALLYPSTSGPATAEKGGISKSNPDAGNDDKSDDPIKFDVVTTGDKAGASILTILVLVSIVVGAWWMVS